MIRTAIFLLASLFVAVIFFSFRSFELDALQILMVKRCGLFMGISAGLCFVLSELSKNYSQFDKLWSIMPVIYVWTVAGMSNYSPRLLLMAILVTLWGMRLTYNFARRGGYSWKFWEGREDYRWAVLQQRPEFQSRAKWRLFNFFFISLYQNVLVLLFCLPIVLAWQVRGIPLNQIDLALGILFLLALILETVADQQQWNFQNSKDYKLEKGLSLSDEESNGFISSGLWKYVRHPNYSAEQAIWFVYYLIPAVALGMLINWSIAGLILLLLLFWSSSNFSEEISTSKYPEYKNYQALVPRFLPFTKF